MNDERRTPRGLFDSLNEKFAFTVDAAATAANTLVAGSFWDKATDGLQQDWRGHTVWCNPPYSRGQLRRWVSKAMNADATTLMLLPGDCSTEASQLALGVASAILFLNKRLAFDVESSGAKFCNWLVLFGGGRRDRTNLTLLQLGVVL